jgi:glycosyltransferase involved in cell wall biosynthesis
VRWSTARLAGIFAARFRGPEPDVSSDPSQRSTPADAEVDGVFFRLRRREGRQPLVVVSSRCADAEAASRFAQLAVLLGAGSSRIAFHWLGPADAAASAVLNAAGVVLLAADDPVRRATRLRPAWVCVGLGGADMPVRLGEAMALGLPCIAWDTPAQRALIEHETNGLRCDSEESLLTGVAALIDSSGLRLRLGQAARHDALRRSRAAAPPWPADQAVAAPASDAVAMPPGSLPLEPGR